MRAASLLARAEMYLDLSMAGEARNLARTAEEVFAREGMELDAVLARIAEARSLLLLGRSGEAIEGLESARAYYGRKRIRPRLALVRLLLARAHLAQSDFARSGAEASQALRTYQSLGMKQGEAEARCVLSETALASGRAARAEQILAPALARIRVLPLKSRLELLGLAGRISRCRGKRSESIRRLRRAVSHLEDRRRLIPGHDLRSRSFDREVRVYHELISLLVSAGRAPVGSIFRLVESARGRGFRERMISGGGGLPATVERKRALLGSLVREVERTELDRGAADPATVMGLRRRMLGLEAEIAGEIRRLEAREVEGRFWAGGAHPDRIARMLEPDEAVVEYFVAGDQTLAFVVRRGGATLHRLEGEARARPRLEEIRQHLDFMAATAGRPLGRLEFHRRATEAASRDLYEALLAPLASHLPTRGRLVLIPHAHLHLVPFECLHDGEGYLDERWSIARAPTADFLLRRAAAGPEPRARTLLAAGTVTDAPPFVGAELRAVASFFPGARILEDPSSRELLEALKGAGIIHLSSHGHFREDNPAFSRLSLKDDALFLADIAGCRLDSDLVVLSACNTGRVFSGGGDDLLGVAHAFLAAGARRLLASHWRVHDEATQEWMEAFYGLLTGEARFDPVRALQGAGRAVRRRWDHPFYWGAFGVHGS